MTNIVHCLYTGVTMTGKTTLARHVARELSKKKTKVIVRDPVFTGTAGGGWPEDADIFGEGEDEDFFEHLGTDAENAHVFIDEAGDLFTIGQKHNFWLLTRGRHYGLTIHLICQRPKMLAPSVRGQVGRTFMFRMATDDVAEICKDMGHDYKTLELPLDTGDFYVLNSGQAQISRANVFTDVLRVKPPERKSK